jgi:hypothetical protein
MILVKQPEGSKLCGQTCLAMILEIPLEDAIVLVGHSKGTKTRELAQALKLWGLRTTGKLVRRPKIPEYCIAKIPRPRGRNWHWVVYWEGKRYDPLGYESGASRYEPSSFLEIIS